MIFLLSACRDSARGSVLAFKHLRLPASSRYRRNSGELRSYYSDSWSDDGRAGFPMTEMCGTKRERRGSSDAGKFCAILLAAGK